MYAMYFMVLFVHKNANVSMSCNMRGRLLIVVLTFAMYTTFPIIFLLAILIINFCPFEITPHTGSDHSIMNAKREPIRNSSSQLKSNSGDFSWHKCQHFCGISV